MKKTLFLKKGLSCLLLGFCFMIPTYVASPVSASNALITPNNTCLNYMGRIDTSTSNDYVDFGALAQLFDDTSLTLYIEGTDMETIYSSINVQRLGHLSALTDLL